MYVYLNHYQDNRQPLQRNVDIDTILHVLHVHVLHVHVLHVHVIHVHVYELIY